MHRFLIVVFVFVSFHSNSQSKYKYNFPNTSLHMAFQEIEKQHGINIYYDLSWIEGININGDFSGKTVEEILKSLINKTGLSLIKYDLFTYILIYELKSGQIVESYNKNGEVVKKIVLGEINDKITQATISGIITDAENKQKLIGTTVYSSRYGKGTTTNSDGFFEISLPTGEHILEIGSVGYNKDYLNLILQSDDTIDLSLVSSTNNLEEVIVTAEKVEANVSEGQASRHIIKIRDVEFLPSLMGEKDIIKTIELLPGVNATGEGSNGYSVRGGNAGQNLIFLEGAPLYNPSHLFGIFSVFNSGLVESAVIYKGTLPIQYGGRVSSVMDVNLKEGNNENLSGEVGIGLMSSRMSLEGPIGKKLSIVTGARVSYINRFLEKLHNYDVRNSRGSFYDINTKLSYELSDKNKFIINGFLSEDKFTLPIGDKIAYGNKILSSKWNHSFSDEIIGDLTISASQYYSSINSGDSLTEKSINSNILTSGVKGLVSIFSLKNHNINIGFENSITIVDPGIVSITNPINSSSYQIEKERGLESAIFFGDEFNLTGKLTINFGLRYSYFLQLGSGKEYLYESGEEKRSSSVIDSVLYNNYDIIKSFGGFEPRLFLKYKLNNNTSAKFNLGRSRQYLHLVSNSASVSPLSIWKLSDNHLKPEIASQAALGIFKKIHNRPIEVSGEIFYREIENLPDYKNGADLIINPNLERALVSGNGKSYGLELQFSKKTGKISGWLAYAYTRSLIEIDSEIPENRINNGTIYSSDNDRPHSLSLSGDYLLSRLWSFSFNWVYTTGRPVSFPETVYYHDKMPVAYYSDRNQYRIPDYHRLDLSINWKGASLKVNKKWDMNWIFSVYNIYGRANAYSVYFEREGIYLEGKKLSILAEPIPSVTMIIKF